MEVKSVSPALTALQPVVVETPKSSTIEKIIRVVIGMGLFAALSIGIMYIAPTFPMTVTIIVAVSFPLVVWGLIGYIIDDTIRADKPKYEFYKPNWVLSAT